MRQNRANQRKAARCAVLSPLCSRGQLWAIFLQLVRVTGSYTHPTVVMVTNAHQNPSQNPRMKGLGKLDGFHRRS